MKVCSHCSKLYKIEIKRGQINFNNSCSRLVAAICRQTEVAEIIGVYLEFIFFNWDLKILHFCQPRGKAGSRGWQRRLCAALLGGGTAVPLVETAVLGFSSAAVSSAAKILSWKRSLSGWWNLPHPIFLTTPTVSFPNTVFVHAIDTNPFLTQIFSTNFNYACGLHRITKII